MSAATSFTFEHSHRFTEKEYVELVALPFVGWRSHLVRRAPIVAVAVACLFWPYTMLLGVVVLALFALGMWAPRMIPETTARMFHESKLLGHTLVYGVSESEMWVHGPGYSARAGWPHLRSWSVRGEWLVLRCADLPPVYLPTSSLSAAGLRARVTTLARAHAAAA